MHNYISYEVTRTISREVWSLEEVKNYLRVAHDNDDRLIDNLIKSAIDYAERFLRVNFATKEIICKIHSAPACITVKYQPILQIDKVYLVKDASKEDITTEFTTKLTHPNTQEKIRISPEFCHQQLEISYQAGLGKDIPHSLAQGILMHVGMMYDFGEGVANISAEIKDIYLPHRHFKI